MSFAGEREMLRIVDARRVVFTMALLVSAAATAAPVVVVAVADDVQRIVIRMADSKIVSLAKGDLVDSTRWYLARVLGATAILESRTRYKGASVEMRVVAGQSIDSGPPSPTGNEDGQR